MDNTTINEIRTVLWGLKTELQTRPGNMDGHVLGAVRKLGLSDIDAILEEHVPGYKDLAKTDEDTGNKAA